MPIYEYRCQKCGHDLEVLQKVSDPAPDPCPKCGAAQAMERLVSRTSFQLKGGGWYSDLYGSTKKDSTSKTSGGDAASSASSTPSTTTSTSTGTASGSTSTSSGAAASSGSSSGSGGSSSGGSTP